MLEKSVLSNGVTVLTETVSHVGSANVGIWCRTGSSNELEHEAGITHLIEHMLFKGSKNRTSAEIAREIEGKGGALNAFTDKEQTCYYCHVLAEEALVGLDVLSDMVCHPTLDPNELALEKGVVVEEIKRGEDEPGDHVHELQFQGAWPSHVMGLPIIGTEESVTGFDRQDLQNYMNRRYIGSNLLVSVAGNIEHQAIVDRVSLDLGEIQPGEPTPHLAKPEFHPGVNLVSQDVQQVHFCIGTEGTSYYDDDFYSLIVLNGVLGGGMSSRLFQEIREKRGLVYSVGSYRISYTCGGMFNIFGGTGMQKFEELQDVCRKELDAIRSDGPTEEEIEKVKQQIAGSMILSLDSMGARMRRMAKNEIVFGRDIPIEETVEKIRSVKGSQVKDLANRILDPSQMRTTAIGPFKNGT